MNPRLIECLGWLATAVFVGSYFFGRPALLRKVQMLEALPVMVANLLVFSAAAWTALRQPAAPPVA